VCNPKSLWDQNVAIAPSQQIFVGLVSEFTVSLSLIMDRASLVFTNGSGIRVNFGRLSNVVALTSENRQAALPRPEKRVFHVGQYHDDISAEVPAARYRCFPVRTSCNPHSRRIEQSATGN
jgi:hypothetical protein